MLPGDKGMGFAGLNTPQVTQDKAGTPRALPAYLYAFNPVTGIFDMLQIDGNASDGETPVITGLLKTDSYMYGYNRSTDKWSRIRINENANEGLIVVPGAVPYTNSQLTVTNVSASAAIAASHRSFLEIQNNDAAGIIYVSFGVAATAANGYAIYPGGSKTWNNPAPSNQIFVIGSIANNPNCVLIQG